MKCITAVILIVVVIGSSLAIPVAEDGIKPIKTETTKTKEKLRQDEEDGVGEIEQVGEQVSKIISGVLTGNLGQIFGGSTGFIEDSDTQLGVDNILVGVAQPLNTILAQTVKQGQQYYNITTPAPPTLEPPPQPPQPVLVVANPVPVNQPQIGQPQFHPLDPIVIQPQAPAVVKAQEIASVQQVPVQQLPVQQLPVQQQVPVQLVPVQQLPIQPAPPALVTDPEAETEVPAISTANPGEDEDEDSESEAKL